MNTPIDGRPIAGPAYSSWTDRVKVPETPFDTDYFARDMLVSRRLQVATHIYAAALHGCGSLIDSTPARLADQAVQHADRLIRANDQFRPAPPPAPPAPSLSLAAVRLLAHLVRTGRAEAWEPRSPAGWRELLKAGLAYYLDELGTIAPTPDGIALMRGDAWNPTPSTPTAASSETASSTPATTASAVPAG